MNGRRGQGPSGSRPRILRQAVVEPYPIHFFRDPHVIGRHKGVAVIERRQRNAGHGRLLSPGEQASAANLAKDPVERLRRGIAGGLAFNGQGLLVEQRAGKERRSHRLLAVAAMADTDIDRLALRFEPNRAAQASAFPDHDDLSVLILRSGVFAASRRMSNVASWFETAQERLLTMRADFLICRAAAG